MTPGTNKEIQALTSDLQTTMRDYRHRGETFLISLPKFICMPESTECPKCNSPFGYPTGTSMMCPECGHEWNTEEVTEEKSMADSAESIVVKDANGNPLQDGDTVVLIKDLPVKGAPRPIKAGTKVKNIKLTGGDHNIDCKIDGFGAMALKSIYVRKG
jgi:protein PhnA